MATLEEAVDALDKGARIRLEQRPARYMFGCLNYGELPHYKNEADGDMWDVFVPGYDKTLKPGHYDSTEVIGALMLTNGNHKIAIRIAQPGYDARRAREEIHRYSKRYCARVRVGGKWTTRLDLLNSSRDGATFPSVLQEK